MTYSDYKYERPNYPKIKEKMTKMIKDATKCHDFDELYKKTEEINKLRIYYMTMKELAGVNYSTNMNNIAYIEEHEYFNDYWPYFEALNTDFYKMLLDSPFLPQLKEKYGEQFFRIAENGIKTKSPEVLNNLAEDNRLINEVSNVKNSKKIYFLGKERNTVEMAKFMGDKDRTVRKAAADALYGYYESIQNEIDLLYDQMVKVRDARAKKLGYKNFVELGYVEMNRIGYDAKDVKNYRNYIYKYLVPVVCDLIEHQKKRIKIDDLQYYDESFKFLSGNPTPIGDTDYIIEQGIQMFDELSPETGEYFRFMTDRKLLDVYSREGKETGGFCQYIPGYKSPYVFSDFNGTSEDVKVLTHEAGHGFQHYMSSNMKMPENCMATMEASETHSKSMEFFTHPYMEKFFGENALKYKYLHIVQSLEFIPYGAAVDEFQHIVYENPNITPMERRKIWRDTEKKYMPYRKYDDNPFLESGTWWYKQGHIFFRPFYYIDYTLAQICAFQFWKKMNINKEQAWKDYINLCKLGGSKSFLELIKDCNLKSPFEEETIIEIVNETKKYLDSIDDSSL